MKSFALIFFTAIATGTILSGFFLWHSISNTNANVNVLFADYTPGPDIPAPADDREAFRLLAPENHLTSPVESFRYNPEARRFYQRQLKAIGYVQDHQLTAAVPELIVYLDYPTNFMVPVDPAHGKQLDILPKLFPAYGALLGIPGSASGLQAYCNDPAHPWRSRMTALEVLHAVDESAALATANKMHDAEKDAKRRAGLEEVIAPNAWFHFWFEGEWGFPTSD